MTNRFDLIDEALIRPGRLEIHGKISLPNCDGREQILRIHTNKMKNSSMMDKNINLKELAEMTNNYTGAELEAVVKSACSYRLNYHIQNEETDIIIKREDFIDALKDVKPKFGNKLSTNKITFRDKKIVEDILKNIRENKIILVNGNKGSGKTTLIYKIGSLQKNKYVKILTPKDVIGFTEYEKVKYYTKIITETEYSRDSLILMDDLEILINFVNLGNVINFSNTLYQTILTIIKISKIPIIVTCGCTKLIEIIGRYFDHLVYLDKEN